LGDGGGQVLADYGGRTPAAFIILTDGQTTEGDSLAQMAAKNAAVPLHLIGIGDEHGDRDLELEGLRAPKSVYVNDRIVFDAQLTGKGYLNLTVPVTLHEKRADGEDGDPLHLEPGSPDRVTVDPKGSTVKIQLRYQPREPGKKRFVIKVPVQPDEKGRRAEYNNRVEYAVLVHEVKKLKVLYVEGYPRYEYRYIKTLLERESARDPRNKTIDLQVLLLEADKDFEQQDKSARVDFPSKKELSEFDVVILGDVDPESDKIKNNLQDLAEVIRENGCGLLMIAGERSSPEAYRGTPLADILPINVDDARPGDA